MYQIFFFLFQIGSFFMINLCLVVIATQFSETKKRETERMMQERKRFQSSSTLASNSEPGGCYDEILKYIAHLCRRLKRRTLRLLKRAQGRRQRKVTPEKAISLRRKQKKKGLSQTLHVHHHHHHHHHFHIAGNSDRRNSSPRAPRASPEISDIDPVSSPRRPNHLVLPGNNSLNPSSDSIHSVVYTASDMLAPYDPAVLKSQQSSPNHLVANLSVSRTHSFSGRSSPKGLPPEMLAVHGAKNAALAATNSLLNVDYDVNKLNPNVEKNPGMYH
jgi:hypothetical protein